MNKKSLIFTLALIGSDNYLSAISLGSFWQKTEQEQIIEEYPVPSRSLIKLSNINGSYTIKPWNQDKIKITATKKGTVDELKDTTITCKVEDQEAVIRTHAKNEQIPAATVDYILMVPEEASLDITQNKGSVKIKGVSGSIDVSLAEGAIDIIDSVKRVSAKTGSGVIEVQQKRFDDACSIFLESQRGNITLHLPLETRGLLHAKASGTITSEHPVTLSAQTTKLNKDAWEKMKKDIDGTLSGGGAPITLEAAKGSISLKEY